MVKNVRGGKFNSHYARDMLLRQIKYKCITQIKWFQANSVRFIACLDTKFLSFLLQIFLKRAIFVRFKVHNIGINKDDNKRKK